MLHLHSDEHNPMHGSSCLKKGPACRFNFGKGSFLKTGLGIENEEDNGSNVTVTV